MVGEKRITKTFQYDAPGKLVMTYLSQVSATILCCLQEQTVWTSVLGMYVAGKWIVSGRPG